MIGIIPKLLKFMLSHSVRFDSLFLPSHSSSTLIFFFRFSSAISACEKCGQWRTALDLLDQMVSMEMWLTTFSGMRADIASVACVLIRFVSSFCFV